MKNHLKEFEHEHLLLRKNKNEKQSSIKSSRL